MVDKGTNVKTVALLQLVLSAEIFSGPHNGHGQLSKDVFVLYVNRHHKPMRRWEKMLLLLMLKRSELAHLV